MTQTDFMSWRMEEDPILRSTIVAVALLDRSPDQSRFVDMMRRAVDLVPLFRRAAIEAPMGLAPPRWADDPDFDLSWHLRRYTLPEPRTWDGVLDFARTAEMTAFDKRRPLWEFTVLDGLHDGKSALVMKVHHSLTDGVSGMQIAREIVDFTRDGGHGRTGPSNGPPRRTVNRLTRRAASPGTGTRPRTWPVGHRTRSAATVFDCSGLRGPPGATQSPWPAPHCASRVPWSPHCPR
ncbi:wax ester/triacylglycerol synthase domain-containing protein [Rhodococcus opacus]|uniref:wax ester/triacylglycerol synthase domain-containing protein n=1 Tax=Rhodococcus opacus TaxID=37919 RepID=UPI0034D1B528